MIQIAGGIVLAVLILAFLPHLIILAVGLFILAVFVVAGALIGAAMAPNTWAGIIGAGMGLIIGISVLYGIAED